MKPRTGMQHCTSCWEALAAAEHFFPWAALCLDEPAHQFSERKTRTTCLLFEEASDPVCIITQPSFTREAMSEPTRDLTNKPFAAQLSHVYLSILALFCFKLFVKISLNLLAYFYIVRGNRKEAARISAEFYDYGQHSKYHHKLT